MSVTNGQKANADTFNNAFVSKTTDSSTSGVLELANTADADSGATVANVQQAINETFDAVGMSGIGDAGRKTYTSTAYVANGDSHKVAIGKLDNALSSLAATVSGTFSPVEFDMANNTADQVVTGLIFDSAEVLSFEFRWTVYRVTTGTGANTKTQTGRYMGVFNGTSWVGAYGSQTSEDAGVTIDIDPTTGQIEVSTDDQDGDDSISKFIYQITDSVEVPA